jgi:hypothetical protein
VAEFAVHLPAGTISTTPTTSAATDLITPDKVMVTVADPKTMVPPGGGVKLKKSLGSKTSPAFTLVAGTSCGISLDIELVDGHFDRLKVASVAARTELEQQGVLQAWSPTDVAAKFDELRGNGVNFDLKHIQMLDALKWAYDRL